MFYQFYTITYYQIPGKYSTCSLDTVSLTYILYHHGEKEHRDINFVSTALNIYNFMMDNTDCELDRIQNDQNSGYVLEGFPRSDEFKCPSTIAALLHMLE